MTATRYPKFDVHAHVEGPKAAYVEAADAFGIHAALNMSYSGFREPDGLAAYEFALQEDMRRYPKRFRYCTSFSITHFDEPGYADGVIAKLGRDVDDAGAVAVKIWKDLGMMLQDGGGRYVFCDDPRFAPVFDFIAAQGLVLVAHLADPRAAWLPLDPDSPHYGYYSRHPEFHWYGRTGVPSHDEILEHRAALLSRYPGLRMVACHLASLEHDVRDVAAFLDAFPNAAVDVAGRWADLMRQDDDVVHEFFRTYQDRILFGTDWEVDASTFSADPAQRASQIAARRRPFAAMYRYFEEQLDLPEETLRKFYWQNAADRFGLGS